MTETTASADAVKMMRNVSLKVKVKRGTELKWRIWLGAHLLHLAALLLNCDVEIEGLVRAK